jgi:hypothetical protein
MMGAYILIYLVMVFLTGGALSWEFPDGEDVPVWVIGGLCWPATILIAIGRLFASAAEDTKP